MRITGAVILSVTLLAWAVASVSGQAMTGGQATTTTIVQDEGAMESRSLPSHATGGAIGYGGGGGGRSAGSFSVAGTPPQPGVGGPRGMRVMLGTGMRQPSVVVVPTSKVDPEAFASVADGMRVMSHILRQNLSKGHGASTAVFTDYGDLLGGDQARLDGLYIQGYGVFLFAEVRLARPTPSEDQAAQVQGKEGAADPVWEQAKQELQARGEGGPMGMPGGYGASTGGGYGYGAVAVQSGDGPDDGWETEELTAELIRTFKHAANIRSLSADELVTLTVTGRIVTGNVGHTLVRRQIVTNGGPAEGTLEQRDVARASGTTTFTLQAKKSDIDQFAEGKLSLDQFRLKVKVFTY